MAFYIKIYDSTGNEVSHQEMDKIICKLWNIPESNDKWATPQEKHYINNWHELLGFACMAINRNGIIKATDLLEPIINYTTLLELDDLDNKLKDNMFELKLLLFWIKEGYWFVKS